MKIFLFIYLFIFLGQWKGKNCAIKVLKAASNAKEMEEFIREFSVMMYILSFVC